MKELPPYLTPGMIARACRMRALNVKRLLRRVGIAEKHGDRWKVGESRLRERFPEMHQRVFEFYVLDVEDKKKGQPAPGGAD